MKNRGIDAWTHGCIATATSLPASLSLPGAVIGNLSLSSLESKNSRYPIKVFGYDKFCGVIVRPATSHRMTPVSGKSAEGARQQTGKYNIYFSFPQQKKKQAKGLFLFLLGECENGTVRTRVGFSKIFKKFGKLFHKFKV